MDIRNVTQTYLTYRKRTDGPSDKDKIPVEHTKVGLAHARPN